MKNQTLSIEQMKHLKDLGVDTSKASMVYHTYKDTTDEWIKEGRLTPGRFKIDENSESITSLDIRISEERLYHDMSDCSNYSCCEFFLAFTLQDMLEMIPKHIHKPGKYQCAFLRVLYRSDGKVSVKYSYGFDDEFDGVFFKGDNILICVYQMLCWLAENNYLNKER